MFFTGCDNSSDYIAILILLIVFIDSWIAFGKMSSPLVADTTVFFASIEDGTPEFCVQFASNPSVHVYHALKCKLTRSTDSWIKEFVEQGNMMFS